MFLHTISIRLRILVRNRFYLLWLFWFPLALSTFFYLTFTNLDSIFQFAPIPTAVVEDDALKADASFANALNALDGKFLDITYCQDTEEAMELLKTQEVSGIFSVSDNAPLLTVGQDSSEAASLLKHFLDEYLAGSVDSSDFTEEISLSQNPPSSSLNYYYSLLALVCLYGCFSGFETVIGMQGNLSYVGARRCAAPARRLVSFLAELTAALILNTACLIVSMAYMSVCLKVPFGSHVPALILTGVFGSITGISFGAFIASLGQFRTSIKEALMMCSCMLCSILGGLVVEDLGYLISRRLPLLSYLNPAARISDSFYSLYCYGVTGRLSVNLLILTGLSLLFLAITFRNIRRVQYEHL
ncbi:MAG TPA: ABC transporter permease [Candidatus Limivivens merdigallinarum]|uniref:ABC transporter permease n=1 Tax=Candidatus Limivivens merdigallinarum TaxID=2840859 RepID=A0A9D0ZUN7_9FIRM|nr:ABC transporter permease [Candidatus Limivivens merdigallinarum]